MQISILFRLLARVYQHGFNTTTTTYFLLMNRDKFCVASHRKTPSLSSPRFLFVIAPFWLCQMDPFVRGEPFYNICAEKIVHRKYIRRQIKNSPFTVMWLWQSFDLCIDMSRRCRHSARFFLSFCVLATYKFIKTKQFAYP